MWFDDQTKAQKEWRTTASGLPDRVSCMTSARGCEAGRGLTRIKITNYTLRRRLTRRQHTYTHNLGSHCARRSQQSLHQDEEAFLHEFAPDNILIAPHRASFRRFRICLVAVVRSFHTSQGRADHHSARNHHVQQLSAVRREPLRPSRSRLWRYWRY